MSLAYRFMLTSYRSKTVGFGEVGFGQVGWVGFWVDGVWHFKLSHSKVRKIFIFWVFLHHTEVLINVSLLFAFVCIYTFTLCNRIWNCPKNDLGNYIIGLMYFYIVYRMLVTHGLLIPIRIFFQAWHHSLIKVYREKLILAKVAVRWGSSVQLFVVAETHVQKFN